MVTVLCVAEKPAIARSLAAVLSRGEARAEEVDDDGDGGEGYGGGSRGLPLRFRADYEGRVAEYRVTAVRGHVFSLDFPPEYKSWDAVEPKELFRAVTRKSAEGKGTVRHLAVRGRSTAIVPPLARDSLSWQPSCGVDCKKLSVR